MCPRLPSETEIDQFIEWMFLHARSHSARVQGSMRRDFIFFF
jgi:hypothetical protein